MKSAFYRNNRRRLERASHDSLIVVPAHVELQSKSDMSYRFRQDSNFYYLTGSDEPGLVLILDKEKNREFLILPNRPAHRDVWDGAIDIELLKRQSGIRDIVSYQDGTAYLARRLSLLGTVSMPLPPDAFMKTYGFYTNPTRAEWLSWMKSQNTAIVVNDLRLVLAQLRQIKTAEEVNSIKKAIAATESSIEYVLQNKLVGRTELEIRAELEYVFIKMGGAGVGFDSVIANGASTATIHHRHNNQFVRENGLFLIDVGAEYDGYSADITRTYFLGNKPSARMEDVYKAVYAIQAGAMDYLKPGISFREYEQYVAALYKKELKKLGLLKGKKTAADYIVHATSHFLGLDVHDAGDYHAPVSPGMVVTVEPGLYLKDEGIGVRIEDDVLITDSGIELLSQPPANRLPRLV